MAKIIIGIAALVGTAVACTMFFPTCWNTGFVLGTHLLPYGLLPLGAMAFTVHKTC